MDEWIDVMLNKGIKGLTDEFIALYFSTKPSPNDYSIFMANQNSGKKATITKIPVRILLLPCFHHKILSPFTIIKLPVRILLSSCYHYHRNIDCNDKIIEMIMFA